MASHTVTATKAKATGARRPGATSAARPRRAARRHRRRRRRAIGPVAPPSRSRPGGPLRRRRRQCARHTHAFSFTGPDLGAVSRARGLHPITPQDLVGQGLPERGLTDEIELALTLGELLVDGGRGGAPARRVARRALVGKNQAEATVTLFGIPLGISAATGTAAGIVEAVEEVTTAGAVTCAATAGTAAVASAVRAAVDGATVPEALAAGRLAAELGELRGRYTPGASVAQRIEWSLQVVGSCDAARARRLLGTLVGTGAQMQEAIPAAFSLALLWPDEPWRVCIEAALLGGASDTIAAVAGAIVGAVSGIDGLPPEALRMVDRASSRRLDDLARRLVDLR